MLNHLFVFALIEFPINFFSSQSVQIYFYLSFLCPHYSFFCVISYSSYHLVMGFALWPFPVPFKVLLYIVYNGLTRCELHILSSMIS